jgi:hypothetical protein
MLTYTHLKSKPKEFLAVTGLTHAEFVHLLDAFAPLYDAQTAERTTEGKPRRRRPGAGTKGKLRPMEDKLLFILAYEKAYELQTFLALHFGISQPQANYWIHRLLPILKQALAKHQYTPERDPKKVSQILGPDQRPPDLIIDGTERRRQRPKDALKQKENYSGKKNAHPQEPDPHRSEHT